MITKITAYFHAKDLFNIARRAAVNGSTDKDAPIVSIMFSVLALEAFINESGALAKMVPTASRQKIIEGFSTVMGELEDRKESLLVKYHMALLVFSGSTWDEGSQPFQDFKLLVSLRNTIAHTKADKWETKVSESKPDPERSLDQYPKFVKQLYQKNLIELPAVSASWLEVLTQQQVAEWACLTAKLVTDEFLKIVPDGYYKSSLAKHVFKTT
jgi:hypothetical protein